MTKTLRDEFVKDFTYGNRTISNDIYNPQSQDFQELENWIDEHFLSKEVVEGAIGEDEDIMDAHVFFKNKPAIHPAYDYAGGEINGRNRHRKELRTKLGLKEKL